MADRLIANDDVRVGDVIKAVFRNGSTVEGVVEVYGGARVVLGDHMPIWYHFNNTTTYLIQRTFPEPTTLGTVVAGMVQNFDGFFSGYNIVLVDNKNSDKRWCFFDALGSRFVSWKEIHNPRIVS